MSPRHIDPVMYLLADPKVEMSKGKFGAQAGHATMLALELSPDNWLKHVWRHAGGHYAKVVLQCENLQLTKNYIEDRGFACGMVIDEGRTEFGAELTPTFLGVQIVNKNSMDVQNTFGQFKLYPDPLPGLAKRLAVAEQMAEDAHALLDELERKQRLTEFQREFQRTYDEEKHSFIDKLKERARAYSSRRDSGVS